MPERFNYFSGLLSIIAIAFSVYLLRAADTALPVEAVLFFALLVVLSESFCIDLPKSGAVSVTFTIILSTALLFGPVVPAICGFFGAFVWRDLRKGTHFFRWAFNGAQYSISAGGAGLAYATSGGPVLAQVNHGFAITDFPGILFPVILAITTFFLLNTLLVSLAIGLWENISPINVWLANVRWATPHYFALAPLGIAIAEIFMTAGYVGVVLIFLPLIVARQTFQVYMRLKNTYLGTIQSLVAALEAKDPYTRAHSERVAEIAERIGEEFGLSENDLETLRYAGTLHDIGKIGIARHTLKKPARLTEDEYQRIRLHPESGALILREIDFLKSVVPVIFHHHEQFDGSGYGDGIKGEEIPLLARILTVADAYDAMTSPRPYRPAMDKEIACQELIAGSGTQFDPKVVEMFLRSIDYSDNRLNVAEGQMQLDETTV